MSGTHIVNSFEKAAVNQILEEEEILDRLYIEEKKKAKKNSCKENHIIIKVGLQLRLRT